VPFCFFKIMLNTLEKQLIIVKIFDDHVFCHAPSQSSAWKLSTATRCF
jgi:hypothetical protein